MLVYKGLGGGVAKGSLCLGLMCCLLAGSGTMFAAALSAQDHVKDVLANAGEPDRQRAEESPATAEYAASQIGGKAPATLIVDVPGTQTEKSKPDPHNDTDDTQDELADHSARDLQAQEDMAFHAKWMMVFTGFTTVISFAVAILVGWTLVATREAARHAKTMADEAQVATAAALQAATAAAEMNEIGREANQTASEAAYAGIRPWIFLKEIKIEGICLLGRMFRQGELVDSIEFEISVLVENLGSLPFIQMKMLCNLLPEGTLPKDGVPVSDGNDTNWEWVEAIGAKDMRRQSLKVKAPLAESLRNERYFWLIIYCVYNAPGTQKDLETVQSWQIHRRLTFGGFGGEPADFADIQSGGELRVNIISPHIVRMT